MKSIQNIWVFFISTMIVVAGCNPFSSEDKKKDETSEIILYNIFSDYETSVFTGVNVMFDGLVVGPIHSVDVLIDDFRIGSSEVVENAYSMIYAINYPGASREVKTIGFNEAGDSVFAIIDYIKVITPELEIPDFDSTCIAALSDSGVDFNISAAQPGVSTPVNLIMPIQEIGFRYLESDEGRGSMMMDCDLAMTIVGAIPVFKKYGVKEVLDIGVYNYRCIGGGTPPNCPNGVSQHAYAKALDIGGFVLEDSATLILSEDWVINDSIPTCDIQETTRKDSILHLIACEMHDLQLWGNTLTPNYNDAHWNHFHLDLKEGDYFLKKSHVHRSIDDAEDWH